MLDDLCSFFLLLFFFHSVCLALFFNFLLRSFVHLLARVFLLFHGLSVAIYFFLLQTSSFISFKPQSDQRTNQWNVLPRLTNTVIVGNLHHPTNGCHLNCNFPHHHPTLWKTLMLSPLVPRH